ncbi:hypothetical protein C2G38_2153218 [Gigaspora rosea]|uniref:Uncharacterized protein n=1 Tax=Gigaspora rosea TaxID=44941 RepID=A0A397W964_9GLOM|nr:hypothetical protein C2G38_2153218 [Gigaspora rosea]
MPLHASFIAIVVTKNNFSYLTQGIAKYQTEENEFKIIHWKYFYLYDRPYTEFSVGDIVMFAANEIPLSTPHCMIPIQVIHDPKELVIDLIADEVDFAATTSRTSKRPCGMTSKSSKQGTNPPPIINEPATLIPTPTPINISSELLKNKKDTVNDTQDRRTRVEDAPDDNDEDNLEFLLQQKAEEVHKKTRSGRTSKKTKK